MNAILDWLAEIDWNRVTKIFFENYEYLYLLPFPIILIGMFYLSKSIGIKKWYINLILALLTTGGFAIYHNQHISAVAVEIDFNLISAVALELIVGSSMALLAILIFMFRGIFSLFTRKKIKTVEA